jgi:hypothetical protein
MKPLGYGVRELHAHELDGEDCVAQRKAAEARNRQELNARRHVFELCVHGEPAGTQTFPRAQVDTLTNAGALPFWMSYSCNTAKYDAYLPDLDSYDCFGEYVMHGNGQNGAVGYFGDSESSEITATADHWSEPTSSAATSTQPTGSTVGPGQGRNSERP